MTAFATADELVRALSIGVFGGVAGACTLAFPGSPLWLLPAGLAVGGCALTVPEIRDEVRKALPPGTGAKLLAAPRALEHWRRTGEWRPLPGPLPARTPRVSRPPAPWLRTINDEPDRAPHAIVFGPSGAGKTTLARAFLGAREGAAVVLSPKIAADNWAGAEVVTLDDSGTYAPIVAALDALDAEKRRRIGILRREGAQALAPLSVVLDEVPELTANVKAAGRFIVSLAGIGRELKMRLVCLSTSEPVGALGIKGRGDTLANFVRVDIDRERRGTLNDGVERMPIAAPATWGRLAARAELRPWREPEPWPATATTQILRPTMAAEGARSLVVSERVSGPRSDADLLAGMLAAPVPSASGRQRDGHVAAGVSLRPYVPTDEQGHRDGARSDVVVMPRDGGELHLHVHASAEAHAPAPARPAEAWRRQGPRVNARARRRQAQGQDRAAELHRCYREAGAAGKAYRAVYRELGGSKDTTLAAWQEGRASSEQ